MLIWFNLNTWFNFEILSWFNNQNTVVCEEMYLDQGKELMFGRVHYSNKVYINVKESAHIS